MLIINGVYPLIIVPKYFILHVSGNFDYTSVQIDVNNKSCFENYIQIREKKKKNSIQRAYGTLKQNVRVITIIDERAFINH